MRCHCPSTRQYRARLSRIQAALSTDGEVKRAMLRDAEASLRSCLAMDPSDARAYVVLGKLLVQSKRFDEARKLYADGTTATGACAWLLCVGELAAVAAAAGVPRARAAMSTHSQPRPLPAVFLCACRQHEPLHLVSLGLPGVAHWSGGARAQAV
jgi:hypothetical protein